MSFVLEAMKKREARANPDAAVALARQTAERRRNRLWAGLFALTMAINAALLLWVFGLPLLGRDGPAAGEEAEVAPLPAPTQPAQPAATAAAGPAPAAGTAAIAVEAPLAKPAPARPRPAPRPIDVALQDLPDDVRARFPGLAFSTHIYAEDADLRAIVANGERLQEGDRVRGLEIVAITETGVVLAFERYRVSVPILSDW